MVLKCNCCCPPPRPSSLSVWRIQTAIGILYLIPVWASGMQKMPKLTTNDIIKVRSRGHVARVHSLFLCFSSSCGEARMIMLTGRWLFSWRNGVHGRHCFVLERRPRSRYSQTHERTALAMHKDMHTVRTPHPHPINSMGFVQPKG